MRTDKRLIILAGLALVACLVGGCSVMASQTTDGVWLAGDFHTHTRLTDGDHLQEMIVSNAVDRYGLEFLANSEPGGASSSDPNGVLWDDPARESTPTLLGDAAYQYDESGVAQRAMWRWQSLRDYSWPLLFGGTDGDGVTWSGLQHTYRAVLIQGLEWNVPGHAQASVGLIGQPDGEALSAFEYRFDAQDHDTSRSAELTKQNATHADAVAALAHLQEQFSSSSYVLLNQPSRSLAYDAASIRDLHNAAPDVLLGIEGLPGHQKAAQRGGYDAVFSIGEGSSQIDEERTAQARTYGGADIALARVGGLMDSLWGEGRHIWVVASSAFCNTHEDFWPGEYAKTYIQAPAMTAQGVLNGLRSGNVFVVHGDLITELEFDVATSSGKAGMGSTLQVAVGEDVTVTIRFRGPALDYTGYRPVVDHIDLIVGEVTGLQNPGEPGYAAATNPSAHVLATFTEQDWSASRGYTQISYTLHDVQHALYLRLRGTNLGLNVPNETLDGNPLSDDLIPNDAAAARADLWFYSNPIFISVR